MIELLCSFPAISADSVVLQRFSSCWRGGSSTRLPHRYPDQKITLIDRFCRIVIFSTTRSAWTFCRTPCLLADQSSTQCSESEMIIPKSCPADAILSILRLSLLVFILPLSSRAETPPLVESEPILVPATKGKFDYLRVDEQFHRLLANHT